MGTIKPADISGLISSLNTLSSTSKISITNAAVPAKGSKAQKVTIDRLTAAINKLESSFSYNCCQSVNTNCCQSCQEQSCQSDSCESCQMLYPANGCGGSGNSH